MINEEARYLSSHLPVIYIYKCYKMNIYYQLGARCCDDI